MGEVEQRHTGEVSRLMEAIASVETSERQLLKARAVLEARVAELEAAVEAGRQQAAADAEAARLEAAAAAAAAHTQLQQQVGARGGAWPQNTAADHNVCITACA